MCLVLMPGVTANKEVSRLDSISGQASQGPSTIARSAEADAQASTPWT